MIRLIATFGYIGYLRPAPGTWGSLAALPTGWALMVLGGPWLLVVATVLIFVAGTWATTRMTAGQPGHDPSEIVVDEVAGQWIALWPLAFGAANAGASYTALWPGWIAAFLLFRLFDITKWGPVGWADRRNDAMGVMLDDVIAGVFAAIGVVILAGLFHMVLMS
ncbi:phosphatidylglycerophosphatase A [Loktanella sp. SALINAS62]|uniref:phosphatidylglycerophosphatase A family protein n=1 Tax=Loktanella sp. SALINAS62 TaxID=2706124 RepID=UPI001B8AE596|nr:phosphatidylglycerophosphatase A [Loktanella sp. SALINAS62]MBS1303626.1 phosphatidylglycerophosphatase A [Loktanella sp. SALINAS62]